MNNPQKFKPTTGIVNVGEFFVCNCGMRLAKHVRDGVYETIRRDSGQSTTVTSQAVGGVVSIQCNKCSRGMDYLHIQETLKIE